jgi:hypothetical protein
VRLTHADVHLPRAVLADAAELSPLVGDDVKVSLQVQPV